MSAPSSPTRPMQGSSSQRSPGKTSPMRSRENSAAATGGGPSPPKPGIVGPREWEKTLTVKCRLCGGPKCRRCSESAALAKTNNPVNGLHSDWATDSMLGMMRPSTRLFQTYRIVEQFQRLKIKAVFNLTLPGEHPYCGDGLVASGFPYDPEADVMAHNIQFYNFGWEDMTTPGLSFMVDLVKVMTGVLSYANQKLAVHCHAGFGRTGLAIACALVFQHDISPQNATDIVRRGRPGSVQTVGQLDFIRLFYDYVHGSKLVYAMPSIHERFTLHAVAEREGRQYVHARPTLGIAPPKVVSFLCKSLEAAASRNARSICMIFVTHLPATSDGSMASHFEHMKILLGSGADVPLGQAMVVAADELWPHKVKMNTGELSNADIPAECVSGLLLDWLEHLQVPIVEDAKVLATGAAFNALPLLTLRTLECIFNLTRALLNHLAEQAEQDHQSPASLACVADAVVGRTTMACLQLSAVAAKPYFSKVRHLVDTWSCPRPLPLNGARIAELNLALPDVNETNDKDRRMDSNASSFYGLDESNSPKKSSPHKLSSGAVHVSETALPLVKPPSPAHPPADLSSPLFSTTTNACDPATPTTDPTPLRPEAPTLAASKSTSMLTTPHVLNPLDMRASISGVSLTDSTPATTPPLQSSPQKESMSISDAPLLVSVRDMSSMKGHAPRSLPALQIPRKPTAIQ